jgi:hypothetical protein
LPPDGFFGEPRGVFTSLPAMVVVVALLRGIMRFFNTGCRGGLTDPL